MLPACCQHVASMLLACSQHVANDIASIMQVSCEHIASMLLACSQHVAKILPQCYQHVANKLPEWCQQVASMCKACAEHVLSIENQSVLSGSEDWRAFSLVPLNTHICRISTWWVVEQKFPLRLILHANKVKAFILYFIKEPFFAILNFDTL